MQGSVNVNHQTRETFRRILPPPIEGKPVGKEPDSHRRSTRTSICRAVSIKLMRASVSSRLGEPQHGSTPRRHAVNRADATTGRGAGSMTARAIRVRRAGMRPLLRPRDSAAPRRPRDATRVQWICANPGPRREDPRIEGIALSLHTTRSRACGRCRRPDPTTSLTAPRQRRTRRPIRSSFLNIRSARNAVRPRAGHVRARGLQARRGALAGDASMTACTSRTEETAPTVSTSSLGRAVFRPASRARARLTGEEQGIIKRHELTREDKERRPVSSTSAPIGCPKRAPSSSRIATSPVLEYDHRSRQDRFAALRLHRRRGRAPARLGGRARRGRRGHRRHARPGSVRLHRRRAPPHGERHAGRPRATGRRSRSEHLQPARSPSTSSSPCCSPASQLTILPYNRVVADRRGMTANELCERVRQAGFAIERADGPGRAGRVPGRMGMYCEGTWYTLDASEDLVSGAVDPVAVLDVTLLQKHVLELDPGHRRRAQRRTHRLCRRYPRNRGARAPRRRQIGVAFSMCATSVGQLLDVADADLLMPPKSTWFEPKSPQRPVHSRSASPPSGSE